MSSPYEQPESKEKKMRDSASMMRLRDRTLEGENRERRWYLE